MPKTLCTNPDTEYTVDRPVIFDIARQVMEWSRYDKSIPVIFPGEDNEVAQPNSTIDQGSNEIKLPSDTKVFIEASVEYEEDRTHNIAVHQDEHMPYFFDGALGVSLRPVYCPTVIKLTFKLRESDRAAARQWRDDMRARIARYRGERMHAVTYHYMIPPTYARLIQNIHRLRENIAPYGDTISKYLRAHLAREVTTMTTINGNESRLCIKETQGRVSGFFDFDLPEKSQKENETSAHAISFGYTVRLDIPIATAADFPWLVHQQFLPKEFYPTVEDLRPEKIATRASKSMAAFRHFEADVRNRATREEIIRVPEGNEYRPDSPPADMRLAMAVLTTVQYYENGELMPLMNLGDFDKNFKFHPEWLDFIRTERESITRYAGSTLYIGVTVGDDFLHPELYEVTENLDVILKGKPNLRAQHHVSFYISKDPTILDEEVKDRFSKDAELLWLYILVACPRLIINKAIPKPANNRYTLQEVRMILERVRQCNKTYSQASVPVDGIIEPKLVNLLGIDVQRKE